MFRIKSWVFFGVEDIIEVTDIETREEAERLCTQMERENADPTYSGFYIERLTNKGYWGRLQK